jgi:hypothetical protein
MVPVPLNGKECGLPAALSVIVNAAARAPDALGVNVAPSVQLWVAASTVVPVHVVPDVVKSAAFAPVMDTAVILRFAFPVLVRVALITALVVPTFWFPNEILVGASVTAGAGALTLVPVNGPVCGLPAASSAKLTFALCAPSTVGANCTPTLQLFPAFSTLAPSGHAVPLVGATNVNCVGLVPVRVMLVMFIEAWPVLEIVTLFVALDVLIV